MELTTDQKGTIAETAVIHAAVKLDVPVLRPLNDGLRYDLLFDVAGRFLRIQCKWAPLIGDVVIVRCYSCRRGRDGLLRRAYTADEVDSRRLLPPDRTLLPAPIVRVSGSKADPASSETDSKQPGGGHQLG
jgi:hypothetical protein